MNNGLSNSTTSAEIDFVGMSHDHTLATELKWQQITSDLLTSLLPFQRTILGILALHQLQRVDPTPLLLNLACELPGRTAFDAIRFANDLDAHRDVLSILGAFPRLMPSEAVVLLKLAREESMLKHVCRLIQRRVPQSSRFQRSNSVVGMGLLLKTLLILAIIGFICIRIAPEIYLILDDFGVSHPQYTLLSPNFYYVILGLGSFAIVFFIIVAVLFGIRLYGVLFGTRPWHKVSAPRLVARSRFLASLVQATQSIRQGILRIVQVSSMQRLFPGIINVERQIQEGEEPWKALANHKIISQADAALVSPVTPETQAWLLRWRASNQAFIHEVRFAIAKRTLWLVIQTALVIAVLMVCLFVFGSLINILNQLMLPNW